MDFSKIIPQEDLKVFEKGQYGQRNYIPKKGKIS